MEILNKNIGANRVTKTLKLIGKRRIYLFILLTMAFVAVGIGGVVWGGYLYRAGKGKMLLSRAISIFDTNVEVVPNVVNSATVEIDKLTIDLKFINLERLRYQREKALKNGTMTKEEQVPVPAKIRYQNKSYKVDISLTGTNPDHYGDPEKWSYSVKVKDEQTIMGMRKFNLLIPYTRGYLTDWIATSLSKSRGLIGLRQDFVDVSLNGSNLGLYYLEEKFDKLLVESNQKKEGLIFRIINNEITPYQPEKINVNPELHAQLQLLKRLWHRFQNDEILPGNLFDLEKLASMSVITDLLRTKHGHMAGNQRFYFNPITNLCEPILIENETLFHSPKTYGLFPFSYAQALQIGKPNMSARYYPTMDLNPVWKKVNRDLQFKELYLQEADVLSSPQYLDSILFSDGLSEMLISKVHRDDPFYVFPKETLYRSQVFIRSSIYPSKPSIDVFFKDQGNGSVSFIVQNKIDLPVEIHYLDYNNRTRSYPEDRLILTPEHESGEVFSEFALGLPKDIDLNLFSSDSIEIHYSTLGLGNREIRKTVVFPPRTSNEGFKTLSPPQRPSNIGEFDFLEIDNDKKTIVFAKAECNLTKEMIIPKGYHVSAKPGSKIDMTNFARIISYSPFALFGKKDSVITITSSDSTGQGLIVFNTDHISELNQVKFTNLNNMSDLGWSSTGAITFYEAPVNINNCTFTGNLRGDDYLNIVRTNFNMLNTTFENTISDAFDIDFCKGTIRNARFINIGNDAVDASGSKLEINEIEILGAGDKGISAGENTLMVGEEISVSRGEIGIASKDNSRIELNHLELSDCRLGYVAFQKKPEYGPGVIIVNNATNIRIEREYLVEIGSALVINQQQIIKNDKNVKDLLYGQEFGKSSK